MKFTFREDEIADSLFIVLPEGEYVAVIKDAKERLAKNGRAMMEVSLSVFADSGSNDASLSGMIVDLNPDFLLMELMQGEGPQILWKSKAFFKATGSFVDGFVQEFDPLTFCNAYVRVVIGQKNEKYNNKEGNEVSIIKNFVKNYKSATEQDMTDYMTSPF